MSSYCSEECENINNDDGHIEYMCKPLQKHGNDSKGVAEARANLEFEIEKSARALGNQAPLPRFRRLKRALLLLEFNESMKRE